MKRTCLAILAASIAVSTLAQDPSDLENQFYFRFGYSHPTNAYLGVDNDAFWDDFSRIGGTFELGSIFMLNKAALSDGLRLGINLDYAEFSYNQLSATDINSDFRLGLLKISSKIGPSLSYSPASHLVFDVFVKAKIPWIAGIATWDTELEDVYLAGPGFGVATGLNIRYRFLMFGFEFDSDKMKFENKDNADDYFGSLSEAGDKTPMPGLLFTFGFSF